MNSIKSTIQIITLLFCIASCNFKHEIIDYTWKYPLIQQDSAIDEYFGNQVIDPFRNLENLEDELVQNWFKMQRSFHDSLITGITNRDTLLKVIEELTFSSNIRGDLPRAAGNKLFFYRSYKKEKIRKLFCSDLLAKELIELFSTESLNKNFNTQFTIDYYEPSYDGKYLAFALSSNGDEKSTIYIINTETREVLPERIDWAVAGNPQWLPDGSGFFYGRLKELVSEKMDTDGRFEDSSIKLHIVGTDSKLDREVLSRKVTPQLFIDRVDCPSLYVFPTSKNVLATLNSGTSFYSKLYYTSLDEIFKNPTNQIKWKKICSVDEKVTKYTLVGNQLFYFAFNSNSNGSLIKIDLENPIHKEIIFERNNMVLKDIIQTKDAIYFTAFKNGIDSLYSVNLNNSNLKHIKTPISGTIDIRPYSFEIPSAYNHTKDLIFGVSGWDMEWGVYSYNNATSEIHKVNSRPPGLYKNQSGIIVKELEVPSHDGVLVPLSIIYNSNVKLNAKNPTILYAYGAYGMSLNAYFSLHRQAWLDMGGVYAIAHVRGGGEKGDEWYKGGFKATKSNSWKDFIACAQYLINEKYTSQKNLAAEGGSAGGITIGRAITESPELFKAAIISSGVLNTVRFENSNNTSNIVEMGTVKDSLEFQYLYEMDAYHHIKPEINYPSVLFIAGLNDPRVEAWQSGKMVALLQKLSIGKNTVLFRVSKEGHFGDTNYETELADQYTFLLWQLGHSEFKLKE